DRPLRLDVGIKPAGAARVAPDLGIRRRLEACDDVGVEREAGREVVRAAHLISHPVKDSLSRIIAINEEQILHAVIDACVTNAGPKIEVLSQLDEIHPIKADIAEV